MIGEIIGAGLSTLGGAIGGIAGADARENDYKRRQEAYNLMIKKANATQQEGEQAFNNIVNSQNPYLNVIGQDLKNNTNDVLNSGRNQMLAGMAQAGLRGGQLATQLNRGIGNMTNQANQNLNQMMYGDINQNRNLQTAYNQAKALAGLNAGLQQFQG